MAGQCVLLQIYATTKMAECQKKNLNHMLQVGA